MGRTFTPRYRVELYENGVKILVGAWDSASTRIRKGYGRPTPENLERFVMAFAKSLESGGSNFHLSQRLGHIPYPTSAAIVRQKDGHVVAQWIAAPFQSYSPLRE